MAEETEKPTVRKPRADAERNRARLLEVAKAAFAAKGGEVSLDEIARGAGVGIGTLYRHFPTRDDLIAAVYLNETDQLTAGAEKLGAELPPVEALRAWLLMFVDYIGTKQGMAAALGTLVGGTSELYAASGVKMRAAMQALVERAAESGEVRRDIDPPDLLWALGGVAYATPGQAGQEAARRMVDVLMAGLRT